MREAPQNIAASVRARLLNHARAQGQPFDLVLTRFAQERLLFRLSRSPVADRFVLKGAMLMVTWFEAPLRGTRDLDLLGFGDPDRAARWTHGRVCRRRRKAGALARVRRGLGPCPGLA